MSFLSQLASKKVLVVGGGKTGIAVAQFLETQDVDFKIIDEEVIDHAKYIPMDSNPSGFDLAITSPGWRKDHPVIEKLRLAGTSISSELDFAWQIKAEVNPDQAWVAITGTNGKTTTVQMAQSIFDQSTIKAIACGNVGLPAIAAVSSNEKYELLILELSSFQIDWSELPRFKAAAILNIAEDHIDWHGSFSNYAAAKLKVLSQSEIAILNLGDPEVVLRASSYSGRKIFYGLDTPQAGEIGLVEELLVDRAFVVNPESAESFGELLDVKPTVPHNVSNAMAAAGLALALGVPHPIIKEGLVQFKLDSHRLQEVAVINEITWINDSKATNPHAAAAALSSYESIIWIAGGLAKGAKMEKLIQEYGKRIKEVILIGADRELIADAIVKYFPQLPLHRVDGDSGAQVMSEVVSLAARLATAGDTVLLAPACASMDQFTSYAERGDLFAKAVLGIGG